MNPAASPSRLLPRQRLSLAIHAASGFALIPGFLWLAPPSSWDDPELLAVLGILAVVADRNEVRFPGGAGFDGMIVLVLVTVALVGPLSVLAIVVLPWVVNAVTGRRRAFRIATLADLIANAWQAIAAAQILQAGHVHDPVLTDAGWLILAGSALYTVGWALGPAIHHPLWAGDAFRLQARAFVGMLPTGAVLVVLGTATALTGPLGLLALTVCALMAISPQSFLCYAARTRSVAMLDPASATRCYAQALAVQLGLSYAQRRHLARVTAAATRRPATGRPIDYIRAMLYDPRGANLDAQLAAERWDGRGGPIGLHGEHIPFPARVLAVAETWSSLTARGTAELGHREALARLRASAGGQLDPEVVRAAEAVIRQERVTVAEPAPEPRLHRLHVPAPVRRALTVG